MARQIFLALSAEKARRRRAKRARASGDRARMARRKGDRRARARDRERLGALARRRASAPATLAARAAQRVVEPGDAGARVLASGLRRRRHAEAAPAARRRGQAHLKGGTLNGVQSVAGYVLDRERPALGRGDDREPRQRERRAARARRARRMGPSGRRDERRPVPATSPRRSKATTRTTRIPGSDRRGRARWRRMGRAATHGSRRLRGLGRGAGARRAGEPQRAGAQDPRSLRQAHRRGRVPPVRITRSWQRAIGAGVHSIAWKRSSEAGFTARAALFYLWNQLEQGTACPVTMTFASSRCSRTRPESQRRWRRK